ncbi:VWA domain-containing protein [Nitrincola sp.]|uniref:VWA domain-containing protein n=1 Tax=Nitrincola sp. TaxID=1926584 RepID=UPI003A8E5E30
MANKDLQKTSDTQAIDLFIDQVNKMPAIHTREGRLIFALDATASRQASWDQACQLQSELFLATRDLGGLSVQLCYYRGFGEFRVTPWINDTNELLRQMNGVSCLGGHTQIRKVLSQAVKETRIKQVRAIILVVDCCEEDSDTLCQKAGELGMLNTPVFIFHEGQDSQAGQVFQQICKLSGGAYTPFDSRSADVLRELLAAVAVYASGGRKALEHLSTSQSQHIKRLTQQLGK